MNNYMYEEAKIEIIYLDTSDIITTSPIDDKPFEGEDDDSWLSSSKNW